MKDIIYTRTEAANLVDIFEALLLEHGISVPSPEDSERDPEDMAGLYGSTYYALVDLVESEVLSIICRAKSGADVTVGTFSPR